MFVTLPGAFGAARFAAPVLGFGGETRVVPVLGFGGETRFVPVLGFGGETRFVPVVPAAAPLRARGPDDAPLRYMPCSRPLHGQSHSSLPVFGSNAGFRLVRHAAEHFFVNVIGRRGRAKVGVAFCMVFALIRRARDLVFFRRPRSQRRANARITFCRVRLSRTRTAPTSTNSPPRTQRNVHTAPALPSSCCDPAQGVLPLCSPPARRCSAAATSTP